MAQSDDTKLIEVGAQRSACCVFDLSQTGAKVRVAGPLVAQTISSSKLSAHLINAYTSGSSNIVAGHPRIFKVLGLDSGFPSGMVQAMRDYQSGRMGEIVRTARIG